MEWLGVMAVSGRLGIVWSSGRVFIGGAGQCAISIMLANSWVDSGPGYFQFGAYGFAMAVGRAILRSGLFLGSVDGLGWRVGWGCDWEGFFIEDSID